MEVKHNSKTGQTTIKLSWQETRQFMDLPQAQTVVVDAVKEAVKLVEPK